MNEPGQQPDGSDPRRPWKWIAGVVVVIGVFALAVTAYTGFVKAVGEGGSDPSPSGGRAKEATGACRIFVRAHTHSDRLSFTDLEVRGKDGSWTVSATAVIGTGPDQAREPFVCNVAHTEDPDEWSLMSLCPASGTTGGTHRYLKARNLDCN